MTRPPLLARRHIALGALLVPPVILPAQESAPGPLPRTRLVADSLRTAVGAPGLVVVVTRGDSVLLAEGFGVADTRSGSRATPDHVTQVGSVTKPFTAALLLTLASEGRLKLDTPVGTVVAGLARRVGAVTIGELLSGTSGLADIAGRAGATGDAALLAAMRALPDSALLIPRGAAYSYSNVGLALAGLAAQETVKQPFADILAMRVLRPIGATRSTMRQIETIASPFMPGYVRRGDTTVVVQPVELNGGIAPAGYLFATARDVARFGVALANDGRVNGAQALPASAVQAMLTPRAPIPSMPRSLHYGYGLMLDDFMGGSAWHAGTTAGHSALLRIIPRAPGTPGTSVVVLSNLDGVRLDIVAETALREALDAPPRRATPLVPAARRTFRAATPPELRALLGRYANRLAIDIRAAGAGLEVTGLGPARAAQPVGVTTDGRVWLALRNPATGVASDTIVVMPPKGTDRGWASVFLWTLPRR